SADAPPDPRRTRHGKRAARKGRHSRRRSKRKCSRKNRGLKRGEVAAWQVPFSHKLSGKVEAIAEAARQPVMVSGANHLASSESQSRNDYAFRHDDRRPRRAPEFAVMPAVGKVNRESEHEPHEEAQPRFKRQAGN